MEVVEAKLAVETERILKRRACTPSFPDVEADTDAALKADIDFHAVRLRC